jgi:hypothetical protein
VQAYAPEINKRCRPYLKPTNKSYRVDETYVRDMAPSLRDRHIQMIQEKGRRGGEKAVGYGKRALVETAMFRYKTLIGPTLRARTLAAQQTEARVACSVINRMTQLGMPMSQRVR